MGGAIMAWLGLLATASMTLVFGPVAFYDFNFEAFTSEEALSADHKEVIQATYRVHQRALFALMTGANLALLLVCGILYFKSRR
jgi:hypothetical protein